MTCILKEFPKKILIGIAFLIFHFVSHAQENCSTAVPIPISSGGFGLGVYNSPQFDIAGYGVEPGEVFDPALFSLGLNQKTIWYKFTIPTTRNVSVTIAQPTVLIANGDVGVTIYKSNTCLPGIADISTKLTPRAVFGSTSNLCVDPGTYLIQVSAKASANGPVFIQLNISDLTGSVYDHPINAYDFGTLSSNSTSSDFLVECQSIENSAEVCTVLSNSQDYTKTTWHTFTTPAYFDFLGILLSSPNCIFPSNTNVFGYNLYKGNARVVPITSLALIDGCDSFKNINTADYKLYRCGQLQPNTTYSIQLFFKKDFVNDIRLTINYEGIAATNAPQAILSTIPPSNNLGVLPSSSVGVYTSVNDNLGCNSQHILHPCPPALPGAGILYAGIRYNLSTFYTFQLSSATTLSMSANSGCGYPLLIRLFDQALTNSCNTLNPSTNLKGEAQNSFSLTCLPAGNYTLQILGSDSIRSENIGCNATVSCFMSNLGKPIQVNINAISLNPSNQFSLITSGAFNAMNVSSGVMQSLSLGVTYQGIPDTFGCLNTVLPVIPANNCITDAVKAIYREFVIGDADGNGTLDSGVVSLNYYNSYGNYLLYRGDANSLANAQNVHNYPQVITGLNPVSSCMTYTYCGNDKVCVTPGTYTWVSLAGDNSIGLGESTPSVQFNTLNTTHYSAATSQNLGDIISVMNAGGVNNINTDIDYFSCKDNAQTINGFPPPVIVSGPATKAIYREFYLSNPAILSLCVTENCASGGYFSLFAGRASSGLNALVVQTINGVTAFRYCVSTPSCSPLSAGWYTIVSYGSGPTYADPLQALNEYAYGSYVGIANQINIALTLSCPPPKYNRPYKASIDNVTNAPFLLQWQPRTGSTPAYPKYDTTYTLPTENFNCTLDIPFSSHPVVACDPSSNRVSYYVFKITQESYIEINTQNFWGEVFKLDVRTSDSLLLTSASPIQPCLKTSGFIQLCRLQPGTYTLVIFAGDDNVISGCANVTPTIYIDNTGYSRFDHANKAYDFGTIPPDSIYYNGNPSNLINPLNAGRAASNDFFYCTTGSQITDPNEMSCYTIYNPEIYSGTINHPLYNSSFLPDYYNISKRNLWYTFVIDKPGNVHVKVSNKTLGKQHQYTYAVYKSDVNGSLPFSTVVSTNQVDSTLAQGLVYKMSNLVGYYCNSIDEISFYRDPCLSNTADRYYIVVENRNAIGFDDINAMRPNSQVEVSIMLDSVNSIAPLFDHYYQASNIGTLGAGAYIGATDNFSCATSDITDPTLAYYACSPKTLWYKFNSTITGHVRFRIDVAGLNYYDGSQIQLFRQLIPGDSTNNGLQSQLPGISYYFDGVNYWAQTCVTTGTYYLVLTGCNQVNQFVKPYVQIIEDAGDFCSAPVVASLNGPGTVTATAIVDCHTIGTDYGEFSPNLTCPINAVTTEYKSSWFRLDITGSSILDVQTLLIENTNANNADIQYRLMTGNCGAMQEQSCVQNAATINTSECLTAGSYFVQVFTPILKNGNQVNGDITLQVSAIEHTGICGPVNNCLANAAFIPQFNCNTDDSVTFVNYSTYGTSINYNWNFGYAGQTSTSVSPKFKYPVLATNQTYTVTLTVQNTGCGGTSTSTSTIIIPGRPDVNLGNDTTLCNPAATLLLNASSWPGTIYEWQDMSGNNSYLVQNVQNGTYYVSAVYNNCTSRDTIIVNINPITPVRNNYTLCGNDSVLLNSSRGYGETYLWSTGSTQNSIFASSTGLYTNDITWKGCHILDTFLVSGIVKPFNNSDTLICLPFTSFNANATVPSAINYFWQDGTQGAAYVVNTPGLYWVNVNFGNCSVQDSLTVMEATPPLVMNITATICAGQTYTLPWGGVVDSSGIFTNVIQNSSGCDSLNKIVTVTVLPVAGSTTNQTICPSLLPYSWNGNNYTIGGTYTATLVSSAGCDSIATLNLAVNTVATSITNLTICSTQLPYSWNSNTYTVAGTYTATLVSSAGCDSVATLNLTVRPLSTSTTNLTICSTQLPYSWNSNTYTVAGTYTATLVSSAGCDSVATLNLTVRPLSTSTTNITICSTQLPYSWNSNTYTVAGTFTATLVSSAGCDSAATLNLSVIPLSTSTTDLTICSTQLPYLWNSNTYTVAGTYTATLVSSAGCDSIATLNLAVNAVATSTTNQTICATQLPYTWNGNTYTAGGTYIATLVSSVGCDSIATLNLAVNTIATSTTNQTICTTQLPYSWNGNSYTTAGTYTATLVNSAGCDSVATLNLAVNAISTSTTNQTICATQLPYTWNGNTYTAGGTYTATLVSSAGCDSIATLNLAVNAVATSTTNQTICATQLPYTWNSNSFTVAGTYTATLLSSAGCDSIATLNLAVNTIATSTTNLTICSSQLPYSWNSNTYTVAGTYTTTLVSSSGCDSVATLNLSVRPLATSTTNLTICSSQLPYSWNSNTYTVAGTYTATLVSSAGCDSVATLNLTVNSVATSTTNLTICSTQLPYFWNSNTYTVAGTYTATLVSSAGCDSVATLNLTVRPLATSTTNLTICSTQLPYSWNSNTYTVAGTYTATLVSSGGCDSIATLILAVSATLTSITNQTICTTQLPYSWNGNSYTAGGTYTATLVSSGGCDSIATLNLAVSATLTSTTNQTICTSQLPYNWNGNSYTAGGTYTATLVSSGGCDSVATLNLAVNATLTSTTNQTICTSQLPYNWNGNSYTAGGTYTATLVSSGGCDSIATLNLAVNTVTSSTTNQTICASQLPYTWNNNSYTAAGTYTATLVSSRGCDSIATLNLAVSATLTSTTNQTICASQLPYSWNNNSYTTAGTYTVTLVSSGGCDSVATLNLSVNAVVTSTTNQTICASQLPYSWNNNSYTTAGTYTATFVSSGGCDSVATLNLSVNAVVTSTTNQTICASQLPYSWNNNSYTTAGTYTATFVSSGGCDSIATLNLAVSTTVTSTTNQTICTTQLPYTWNGNSYTAAGTYTATLISSGGCDSIATLNLAVSAVITSTTNQTICPSQLPYSWNSNTYTVAGTYTATLVSSGGCDSIAILNLTVRSLSTSTTNLTICSTQLPYSWNSNTYTVAGTYTATLVSSGGCDSVATLNLNVRPLATSTTNLTICSSQLPYSWNGNAYMIAGTYTATFVSSAGCDSVATLNLNVRPLATSTTILTICSSQLPYSWNGNTFTVAGTYTATLVSSTGCDSVATLNLSVNSIATSTTNQTICTSQLPYTWNGNTYTSAGTYTSILVSSTGCDSIATLNLAVSAVVTSTTNQTICISQLPYLWNGNTYNAPGTYTATLVSSGGCDSVATLNLIVRPLATSTTNQSICTYQLPYSWNGNSYTAAGTYTATLASVAGCDSIATLLLTVNQTPVNPTVFTPVNYCQFQVTTPVAAVAGSSGSLLWYSSQIGGVASTIRPVPSSLNVAVLNYYVSTIKNGCESERLQILVNILPKPLLGPDKETSICFGEYCNLYNSFTPQNVNDTWTLNNQLVNNPAAINVQGDYQLIRSLSGCRDTAVLNLIIHPEIFANAGSDTNIVYQAPFQLNGSGGVSYTWTPGIGLNNPFIANPVAILSEDQQYVLIVKDIFSCTAKDTIKIKVYKGPTFHVPNAFTPNGDGLNDDFGPTSVGIKKLDYFRIFNRYGITIFETTDIHKKWDGTYKGVKQQIGNYVWIVKGIDSFGKELFKKGNVVLIR